MPKIQVVAGMKFNMLTVLEKAQSTKDGKARWLCRCDCGNEKIVLAYQFTSGKTKSCGCYNKQRTSETALVNRVGQRFGKLTVVDRAEDYISPSGATHVRWRCACDCGNETIVDTCQLVSGKTKSCGCLRHELSGEKSPNYKHGGRHSRLYKVYANMKTRCYNENSGDYKYYGGRGIRICDEWLMSFDNFRSWAMSSGYDENADKGVCTIDRIDVNGDYSPENCRWVPMSVQSRNRRNVINNNNGKCPRKNNVGAEAKVCGAPIGD